MRVYGEPPAVVVRQPQAPAAELPPQNTILFNKVGERFTLSAMQLGSADRADGRHADLRRAQSVGALPRINRRTIIRERCPSNASIDWNCVLLWR
jgi:hypothetical protein